MQPMQPIHLIINLNDLIRKTALKCVHSDYSNLLKAHDKIEQKANIALSANIGLSDFIGSDEYSFEKLYSLKRKLRQKEDIIDALKVDNMLEIKNTIESHTDDFTDILAQMAKVKEENKVDISIINNLTDDEQRIVKLKFRTSVAKMHYCFSYLPKDAVSIATSSSLFYKEIRNVASYGAFAETIDDMIKKLDKLPDNLFKHIYDGCVYYQNYTIDWFSRK